MYIRLNTTIIPDSETQQHISGFIERLRQQGEPDFFVSEDGPFPHITMYAPEYPTSKKPEIQHQLEMFFFEQQELCLPFSHIEVVDDGGIFFVYKETPEIMTLRRGVIELLNLMRDDHIKFSYKKTDRFNSEQIKDIEKYGYPLTFYAFPHITLCKFSNREKAQVAIDALGEMPQIPDLRVAKTGLYLTGTFGKCTELIREYNFQHGSE